MPPCSFCGMPVAWILARLVEDPKAPNGIPVVACPGCAKGKKPLEAKA